jgi:glycogen(starch) synthase
MRVLMTTDTIGGVWTFTKELATDLLHNGCAIALVSFGRAPSTSQRSWCERMAEQSGSFFRYEFTEVPLEWMEHNTEAYTAGAPILLRMAESFSPDVFLSSQFCFGALPLQLPKIVVAHSDVLSWAEACRDHPLDPSPWLQHYTSAVSAGLDHATAVVAPTQWMLSALARNFSIPQDTTIIPNGRTLSPATDGPRKLQAITAGRLWDEAKNIKLLNEVVSPIPILVAGESAPETGKVDAPTAGTTFIGPQSEAELLALFAESTLYLCTSIYEPFGLAPLEAALCGCAVLANDIPSLREVWGNAALYFNNAPSLSDLLASLNTAPQLVDAARERSYDRASTFTARRMADSYLALFARLTANNRSVAHAA